VVSKRSRHESNDELNPRPIGRQIKLRSIFRQLSSNDLAYRRRFRPNSKVSMRSTQQIAGHTARQKKFGDVGRLPSITTKLQLTLGEMMQIAQKATQNPILPIVVDFWKARAVAVATELDLAQHLNDGPLHVNEIAKQAGVNSSALFRLLRALESIGIFSQISPYVFCNTSISASLRKSAPESQWATVMHFLSDGCGVFEAWNELGYVIKTGCPSVDKLYGFDFWELLRRNPRANEAMNLAMRSATHDITPAVTAALDWSQFPVIADIGGGIGTQLHFILERAPKSRGILFDQMHLSEGLVRHDRVEVFGGSFFEFVPAGADAYFLRFILHDWLDEEASRILKAIRRSIKSDARLIVVESIIPDGPAYNFGKWLDLEMLVCVRGRERTQAEYEKLFAATGFELEKVIATESPVSLLVAMPT
jgi:hypothetical protein